MSIQKKGKRLLLNCQIIASIERLPQICLCNFNMHIQSLCGCGDKCNYTL